MDFKTFINKENFRAILHQHLKNQIHSNFGNSVLKDIQALSENESALSDSTIASIIHSICLSADYKEFSKSFLNSLNNLFEDGEKYVPKKDNQGTVSQCSSASSINTSIDYISFDQFQDIIYTLSNGVNAEKLEALETFFRLPSLEHIIKRTMWPAVENGLHNALLCNVTLLKDASLKVYAKMLSSPEPKVVQESFNSLIKHLIDNMLSSIDKNELNFISKCKCIVEIIAMLNKFLQNIPNHWLRYPQQVIEDITFQSISILSYGCKNPNVFPIWMCVALCDKKSNWSNNILYGNVSRTYLIDALQKDPYIIQYVLQFCENFNSNENCMSWDSNCCKNVLIKAEITYLICFLSHLLRYSQGREMLSSTNSNKPFSWLSTVDLVMKCSHKLCLVLCFNCCAVIRDIVSKVWSNIWLNNNKVLCCDSLIKILLNFSYIENLPINSVCFIIQCLCYISCDFSSENDSLSLKSEFFEFIYTLLKYIVNYSFRFTEKSLEELTFLNSSLIFMKKILSVPSYLFINIKSINIFQDFCIKISNISKTLSTSSKPGIKNSIISETEQNISYFLTSMLQKPSSISVLYNIELFETSINILLEKILDDIKSSNTICPCDISILSVSLNAAFSRKSILNKSIIFKLSSVIWQLDASNSENLTKVKSILEILIPSIFPEIVESEIFLDASIETDIKLFQHMILFPSLTNQEFIMYEEYSTLALQVISVLTYSIFSSCYLQANYKLSNLLFELQSQHVNENGIVIIDPLSILQNHILVKLYTIGGSKERNLPPETLVSNFEEYNWLFFMNYPVPEVYYHKLDSINEASTSVKLNSKNLKDVFFEYIDLDLLTLNIVSHILKESVNILEPLRALSRTLNFMTLDNVGHVVLQGEILAGIEMTQRYGEILNLIKDNEKELEKLVKAGKCLLNAENRLYLDLFVATLYLIFKSDIQRTWCFLEIFAKSSTSLFIWYERILQAAEQNEKYVTTYNIIMEYCDIIVQQTLPLVFSVFQFNNVLPSVLFKYWTMHCYWNYLEFSEIAHLILVSVIFGGDFAIYIFVSVLKHIQNIILKNAHTCNIINFLKQNPIQRYKIRSYMHFIIELSNIYQSKISKSVNDIINEL